MGKIRDIRIFIEDREEHKQKIFVYSISVNKEGVFCTTLPRDLLDFLSNHNINAGSCNRLGNEGFFSALTMDELVSKVNQIKKLYESCELIEEKLEIEYFIGTCCSYVLGEDGSIYPNGEDTKAYIWKDGNVDTSSNLYGFSIYARPVWYKRFRYCDGSEKEERLYNTFEIRMHEDDNLRFLNSLVRNGPDSRVKLKYIEYNESACKFFLDIYLSLFRLNESISFLLQDDKKLEEFIKEKGRLLTSIH